MKTIFKIKFNRGQCIHFYFSPRMWRIGFTSLPSIGAYSIHILCFHIDLDWFTPLEHGSLRIKWFDNWDPGFSTRTHYYSMEYTPSNISLGFYLGHGYQVFHVPFLYFSRARLMVQA